jgi:predicted RNase H-like nuclease
MAHTNQDVWLAGVDSCPKGWIAVFVRPSGQDGDTRVFCRFSDILTAPEAPAVIAVDIPIGLPKRAGQGGRAAEATVRSLLTKRRPSVFSVPSRCAIYAEIGPFKNQKEKEAARRRASMVAVATSDPPRKITVQSFAIFPKIREVDKVMQAKKRSLRICEVHPEIAFWLMNSENEVADSKKAQAGAERRKKLLTEWKLPRHIMDRRPPKGAGSDDLLDALACAAIARRIHAGIARPFPDPPPRDSFGLPMAIWA